MENLWSENLGISMDSGSGGPAGGIHYTIAHTHNNTGFKGCILESGDKICRAHSLSDRGEEEGPIGAEVVPQDTSISPLLPGQCDGLHVAAVL